MGWAEFGQFLIATFIILSFFFYLFLKLRNQTITELVNDIRGAVKGNGREPRQPTERYYR
jgi:hypothetical protein